MSNSVKIYKCEHVRKNPQSEYSFLWAGDSVRFRVCRLCTNVFLGTIVSGRIKEATYPDDDPRAHKRKPGQKFIQPK
jgi:hypothetical protein